MQLNNWCRKLLHLLNQWIRAVGLFSPTICSSIVCIWLDKGDMFCLSQWSSGEYTLSLKLLSVSFSRLRGYHLDTKVEAFCYDMHLCVKTLLFGDCRQWRSSSVSFSINHYTRNHNVFGLTSSNSDPNAKRKDVVWGKRLNLRYPYVFCSIYLSLWVCFWVLRFFIFLFL